MLIKTGFVLLDVTFKAKSGSPNVFTISFISKVTSSGGAHVSILLILSILPLSVLLLTNVITKLVPSTLYVFSKRCDPLENLWKPSLSVM